MKTDLENPRPEKDILAEVRVLVVEYYQLTSKPLGVTGEIGEFEAAEQSGVGTRDGTYRRLRRYSP